MEKLQSNGVEFKDGMLHLKVNLHGTIINIAIPIPVEVARQISQSLRAG